MIAKNGTARRSVKKKTLTGKLLGLLLPAGMCILLFAWIGIPMIMAILWSMIDPENPWSYPQVFPTSLAFYHWRRILFQTQIFSTIKNSLFIALSTIVTSLLFALPTSYAIGRRRLRGKEVFKVLILIPVVFPGMAMALFLGRVLFLWGFSSTYIGVIMAHTLICLPLMLRILIVSFENMPQELLDAARNLGAGRLTVLLEIYLPMVLPGIIAGAIFTFITSMEEFNLAFIIGAPKISTIPTVLYSYLGYNFVRTNAAVVSLILIIPNMTLLFITERFIKTEYMGAALGKM